MQEDQVRFVWREISIGRQIFQILGHFAQSPYKQITHYLVLVFSKVYRDHGEFL